MGFGSRFDFSQKTVVGAHGVRPCALVIFSPPLAPLQGCMAK